MQIINSEVTSDYREETTVFHNGKTYLREVAGLLYWFVKNVKWDYISDDNIKKELENEYKKEIQRLLRNQKLIRICGEDY